jgi:hypothetical protein
MRMRWLRSLWQRQDGAIAPVAAILLVVGFGFAGLSIDTAVWYLEKRSMQGAADAAASSGAQAMIKGGSAATQARAVAASFGYVDGVDATVVTVNNPPASGSKAGIAEAVEVIIARGETPILASLFLNGPVDINARAVASGEGDGNGEICVLALEVSAEGIGITGSVQVTLPNCGIGVNSSNSRALTITGSAQETSTIITVVGGYRVTGSAVITTTQAPGVQTGQAPFADPYADLTVPPFSGCNHTNFKLSGSGTSTLNPGVYCNGIEITGSRIINMNPGVYYIDRNTFDVSGSTIINAMDGVSIVLTSSTGSNYATFDITGSARLNLKAPATGPTAGMAVWQDRRAPTNNNNSINGSSIQNITGAIYFPRQALTWTGSTVAGGSQCTQVIARTITFVGSNQMKSTCEGVGTRSFVNRVAALFE